MNRQQAGIMKPVVCVCVCVVHARMCCMHYTYIKDHVTDCRHHIVPSGCVKLGLFGHQTNAHWVYQASKFIPPGPVAASNFVAAGLLTALYDTVVRANTIGLQPVVKISHMSQGGRKRRQGMSRSGHRCEVKRYSIWRGHRCMWRGILNLALSWANCGEPIKK